MRGRCKHLYYLEGSSYPDKIVQCTKRGDHSGRHKNWGFSWPSKDTWGMKL